MHKLVTDPFEEIVWNQKRFPKRKFFNAMRALHAHKLKLDTRGFLLTKGNYGHLLIGPLEHNGDIYRRSCPRRGAVHGSVALLIQFGMADAKLMSESELLEMAMARRDYKRVQRESDGLQLDVAMLFPWPDKKVPRSCGIYLTHEGVIAINPENSERYNKPDARYKDSALEPLLKQRMSVI